jgi:hypothetical protein
MYALLAALLACTCATPPDAPRQERVWTARDPRQIVARFAGQPEVALTPEQGFRARERCASVTRAIVTALPSGAARPAAFAGLRAEIEGIGLDRVTRITAHLPASTGPEEGRKGGPPPPHESQATSTPEAHTPGALADIKVVLVDGKLVFPVFCSNCEVVLGVPLETKPGAAAVGCVGPGWSLRFRDGKLADD